MSPTVPPKGDPFEALRARTQKPANRSTATVVPPPRRVPPPSNPVQPLAVPEVVAPPASSRSEERAHVEAPAISRVPKAHQSPLVTDKPGGGGEVAADQVLLLRRDQLVESPEAQPRDQANVKIDIQDLVTSIKTHGLLDAIKVYWDPSIENFRVIDGHRRLAAIDQLALSDPSVHDRIRCISVGGDQLRAVQSLQSDDKWLVLAMAFNAQRKDLTGAERGRVYSRLREKLGTVTAVAEVCGVSRVTVHKAIGYAADSERHGEHGRGVPKPDWAHKGWLNSMHGLLRASTKLEDQQRRAVAQWLRSVARAAERGEAKLPGFTYDDDSDK